MIPDIYNKLQRQATTKKFLTLSVEKQKQLQEELYRTIIMGLRHLVISNIEKDQKDEFEKIIQRQDDGALFLFGKRYVKDFNKKLNTLIQQIAEAFVYDINH